MVISAQINSLANALKWLTGLLGLSCFLLFVSFVFIASNPDLIEDQPQRYNTSGEFGDETAARLRHQYTRRAPTGLTTTQLVGKQLFVANCAQCHAVTDEVMVGPGLLGVLGRAPDQTWLMSWIKNPSVLLASGDAYAIGIVNKYAPVKMPAFPTLKEKDIKAILSYLETAEQASIN